MSENLKAAYNAGFDHGEDQAILCCFGGSKKSWPMFDSQEEFDAYESGYEDGYSSVD